MRDSKYTYVSLKMLKVENSLGWDHKILSQGERRVKCIDLVDLGRTKQNITWFLHLQDNKTSSLFHDLNNKMMAIHDRVHEGVLKCQNFFTLTLYTTSNFASIPIYVT